MFFKLDLKLLIYKNKYKSIYNNIKYYKKKINKTFYFSTLSWGNLCKQIITKLNI